MKILITGGAGFIGSHLVDRLIKEGHEVVVVDNLSTGKKENLNPKAKFYKIDICSPKINLVFQKEKPQVVYHLAAQIDVRKSIQNPIQDAKINILGSLNLVQNFTKYRERSPVKFIFASSVGVYGEPKLLPIKENHSLNPIAPYPINKLTIEKYPALYQNQGLNFVSLRYSNIYGPRQLSTGEGGVIAIFIDKVLQGERPTIFGSGRQTRDFLYVDDAVEAAARALKYTGPTSVFNVGGDKEITVNSLLNLISKILNKKTKPIYKPSRQGEIIHSRIDYSKIKKELGWEPRYDLEKGLERTIEWFV
jgi:UDP-glucose 4-epimerase